MEEEVNDFLEIPYLLDERQISDFLDGAGEDHLYWYIDARGKELSEIMDWVDLLLERVESSWAQCLIIFHSLPMPRNGNYLCDWVFADRCVKDLKKFYVDESERDLQEWINSQDPLEGLDLRPGNDHEWRPITEFMSEEDRIEFQQRCKEIKENYNS
jgi:hypothetical protein